MRSCLSLGRLRPVKALTLQAVEKRKEAQQRIVELEAEHATSAGAREEAQATRSRCNQLQVRSRCGWHWMGMKTPAKVAQAPWDHDMPCDMCSALSCS